MTSFNKDEFLKESYYNEYVKIIASIETEKEAYIYIRVSTEDQVKNSPFAQLKEILEYCIDNKVLVKLENVYVDGGISGKFADNRIEFQKMISSACIKKNPCKLVLVHKYDRFARNKEESVLYKSQLRKYGIKVISIKEPLPEDKKTALILESNLEMTSELYSINLSDEVYKGLRENAENGKHQTRPPYGYKKVLDHIERIKNKDKIIYRMEINEDEATLIRKIFQDFINGKSVLKIAQELNELGLKTAGGAVWYDNRMRFILSNPTYAGYAHWTEKDCKTITKKSNFVPIIDEDTFNKAQELLNHSKKLYIKEGVKEEHWLRGKLKCSNCGKSLIINHGSYQCCNYTHGACKESHSIRIYKVEELVISYLTNLKIDDIININITNLKLQNNDELTIISETIKQINNKLKRVMLAYENEIYNIDEFKSRKNSLEAEKTNLLQKAKDLKKEQNYKNIQDRIYLKCDNLKNILSDENIPILDKSLMIDEVIDKIVFDKKNRSFTFYFKGL